MVNILMVDYDQAQLDKVRDVLETTSHSCNFFGATSAQECLERIDGHKMDVIMIETKLPDGLGVELAEQIRQMPGYEFVWMILFSQDSSYEAEAFKKVHCYDYITKPFDLEKLRVTIDLLGHYEISRRTAASDQQYVTFRQRDQLYRLDARDILYVEVVGNNSTLYTYTRIYCLRKMSLKKLKMMLPDYFVQCHKSFIVNRDYIESIEKGPFGWEINLKNYHRSVPSGDKYKGNVFGLA